MPPKAKKPAAATSSLETIPVFPAPPTMVATKPSTPTRMPEQSPAKRLAGITQAQKQALMDNLQLEITDRARKLRAQYALQAQGLRARLELRVNRIPLALRKTNMQELVEKHAEQSKPQSARPALPSQIESETRRLEGVVSSKKGRGVKRTSDAMSRSDDKENEPLQPSSTAHTDLPNPKKRAKTTATATAANAANTRTTRTVSRKAVPSGILSPKSHNSRTLVRSPFKAAASLEKPTPAAMRPASPVKPAPAPAKAPSRAPSRTTKRTAGTTTTSALPFSQQTVQEHRDSEASSASAGTTIMTKAVATKAAPKKAGGVRGAMAALGGARKTAVAKKANVGPAVSAPTGGRVLRKRG